VGAWACSFLFCCLIVFFHRSEFHRKLKFPVPVFFDERIKKDAKCLAVARLWVRCHHFEMYLLLVISEGWSRYSKGTESSDPMKQKVMQYLFVSFGSFDCIFFNEVSATVENLRAKEVACVCVSRHIIGASGSCPSTLRKVIGRVRCEGPKVVS